MRKYTFYFLLGLWILLSPGGPAYASEEAGSPFFRHFPPREIGGGPQILDGAVDADGSLYFAANRSVLIYDGARWRHIRSTAPRSLVRGVDGRMWVGLDGDLGFVTRRQGRPKLVLLRDELAETDRPTGRIVKAMNRQDELIFVYRHQLIQWQDGELRSWHLDREVRAAVAGGGSIYLYQEARGLVRWQPDGSMELGVVLDQKVQSMLWTPKGLLIGTVSGRLYHWRDEILEPFAEAAWPRLDGRAVWRLTGLRNGRIVVASRGAGALILSPEGVIQSHWSPSSGLPSREVYTAVEDEMGSLWLGTAAGLARVSTTPITFYGAEPGAPGSMLSMTRHDGRLYVGTVEGAFRLAPSGGPDPARFEAVTPITGTVAAWASTPHGLLLAGEEGLHEVTGRLSRPISEPGSADPGSAARGQTVAWLPGEGPARNVALAAYDGLFRVLAPPAAGVGSSWQLTDHEDLLPERVFEIVEDRGDLWLITFGTRNLYRMEVPDDWTRRPRLVKFEMTAPWPRPLRLDEGTAIVDRDRVVLFDPDSGDLRPDERFQIAQWRPRGSSRFELKRLGNGDIWVGTRDRLRRLSMGQDGRFRPDRQVLGLSSPLTFDMRADPERDAVLWLSTEQGPARFEAKESSPVLVNPKIRFLPPAPLKETPAGRPPSLPAGDGAYRFEVAFPYYRAESFNTFQYRLHGQTERWTEPTPESVKEYTNLSPGRYRLEVRAAHAGRPMGSADFEFRVLPPWYATWWARLGLLLLLAWGLVVYGRAQRAKLAREREIAARERAVNQRLIGLSKLKDEFLAGASHELRTPLYGITGLAESLVDGVRGRLPPKARRDLSMLAASSRRLSALVDDLLDFSRLKHQSLVLRRGAVDLRALVDVVFALTRPLLDVRSVRLVHHLDEDLPRVDADENRLQQIFHNLIANAVKSMDSGVVEITAEPSPGKLTIRVRDSGRGIPAERRDTIFEAFEGDEADSEPGAGTGLGLTISRRLVELHGGSIWLESTSSEGTVIAFDLPTRDHESDNITLALEMAEDGGLNISRSRPMESLAGVAGQNAITMKESGDEGQAPRDKMGRRILVVDDEPINRLIACNHLESWGFEVIEAANGPEALSYLEAETPDLVLLDVMMPKMSGYEVCRLLRQRHSIHELPVIFLTAKSQADDLSVGYSSGANDYLVKPVQKHELMARVENHLELSRMHRSLENLVQERTAQLKVLKGLLPICASCKKIRDDQGQWEVMERFIASRSEAEFSHGLCPDCARDAFNEMA